MSAEDCETLSLGLAHGHSLRMMARVLGRAPSTISRESARNTTRGHPYRACTAQTQATARARQPRRPRKLADPWLWRQVRTQLAEGCSPEQIAGRLRRAYPDDMRKWLSVALASVVLGLPPATWAQGMAACGNGALEPPAFLEDVGFRRQQGAAGAAQETAAADVGPVGD